ncbi:hypothetical protein F4806DRAFT_502373 [Annulohypoxylon nitens]|nr:hypothetical protein F4806DRAFT_502373 [Annulohypoxylon nitens]
MCFNYGQFITKVRREQDEQLITDLCDMVATICFEGKTDRYHRFLQSRRIRLFYTDMKNDQDEAQTDDQQTNQSGPAVPKIPRRCNHCQTKKLLIISPLCIAKGGCDRK